MSFEGRTEEGPKDHSGRGDHTTDENNTARTFCFFFFSGRGVFAFSGDVRGCVGSFSSADLLAISPFPCVSSISQVGLNESMAQRP